MDHSEAVQLMATEKYLLNEFTHVKSENSLKSIFSVARNAHSMCVWRRLLSRTVSPALSHACSRRTDGDDNTGSPDGSPGYGQHSCYLQSRYCLAVIAYQAWLSIRRSPIRSLDSKQPQRSCIGLFEQW